MRYSDNVSKIFSESPRRLYKLGLIVFSLVIICAICYLFFVKYDSHYEFEFLINTEKGKDFSFGSDFPTGQLEYYTLMIKTKEPSSEFSESNFQVSTRISEKQASYFSNIRENRVTLYFEEEDGAFTDGIIGSVLNVEGGILVLRINYDAVSNDFLKNRYFVNFRVRGRILLEDIPFVANLL